jgi:hypothetical protein
MDIYAEYGVNNAVMSSSDIAEHEQNMLALNVDARDGDDSLMIEEPEELEEGEEAEQEEGSENEQEEGSEDEFEHLPDVPDDLKAASDAISQYADGFTALRDQAVKNGLPEATAAQIEAEYEQSNKLSAESYAALEKAGYSQQFIDSYIQGQESIADKFVAQVINYAGGKDRFDKIVTHMQSGDKESVESLYEAMERQDLKAIRTILNLGMQSHTKKFGKAPARSVTKTVPSSPAKRNSQAAQGYASQREMVSDMGKPEYRHDPAFRAKVEARVAASSF